MCPRPGHPGIRSTGCFPSVLDVADDLTLRSSGSSRSARFWPRCRCSSSLAASYSAFSDRSPCSLASLIFCAISFSALPSDPGASSSSFSVPHKSISFSSRSFLHPSWFLSIPLYLFGSHLFLSMFWEMGQATLAFQNIHDIIHFKACNVKMFACLSLDFSYISCKSSSISARSFHAVDPSRSFAEPGRPVVYQEMCFRIS